MPGECRKPWLLSICSFAHLLPSRPAFLKQEWSLRVGYTLRCGFGIPCLRCEGMEGFIQTQMLSLGMSGRCDISAAKGGAGEREHAGLWGQAPSAKGASGGRPQKIGACGARGE